MNIFVLVLKHVDEHLAFVIHHNRLVYNMRHGNLNTFPDHGPTKMPRLSKYMYTVN